ncbi:DNA methyltransferase [Paenibacillus sp. D9]|uniref:DNA adenine methylase n=1 Tax=Paenibacillus sp. D9 TaxID=665792 RepID=UPI00061EC48D|nr:DNA adenine methylase [Paenibacillus sp. D9]KKC45841.1 DNA methyltransferase [Paenibacillus sp. D9]
MARSPILWFGGKSKYADHIMGFFPAHRVYAEPFGGGAHVIAKKPRATHEVYNDIDGNVVNFILQASSDPERLAKACMNIPYSRFVYERWKREPLPEETFERAVRWFYLNRSGIAAGNAAEVSNTGWRHSIWSGQNPANGYLSACQEIENFAARMQGVMIECTDFREVIRLYDSPDTLFYVDPPYVGREKFYAGGFSEKDHRDLAEMLNGIQGKAVLSYYEDPLVSELYPEWHKETFSVYKQVAGGRGTNSPAEEVLLMNYDNGQLTLF